MTFDEIGAAQEAIARTVLEAMPDEPWTEVRLFGSDIGGARACWLLTLDDQGTLGSLSPPAGLADRVSALKQLMADPDQGAWFLARLTVARSGAYAFDYEYDQRIYWNQASLTAPLIAPADGSAPQPSDEHYRDELARHPRSAEATPDWLRLLSTD